MKRMPLIVTSLAAVLLIALVTCGMADEANGATLPQNLPRWVLL